MKTKLFAIMLTDIFGYTEYSFQADRASITESIRQQQRIISPLIDQFHGRLVKWIGDAALVVFSSATDAVLCGRRIQTSFIENAERGTPVISSGIKVVIHVGDLNVDKDGDVYGDAVNFASRLEKIAEPDEVYFSETVRRIIPSAEIPHELVGGFKFKGVPEEALVYRTCFGQSPVVRERVALLQTNFVGVQTLADRYGWDLTHPALDSATAVIVDTTRAYGGTNRGVGQTGCMLSFDKMKTALDAVAYWNHALKSLKIRDIPVSEIKVRSAVHWGTLHVMKHTMMGYDVDLVRNLAALGFGNEILLTGKAVAAAIQEEISKDLFTPVEAAALRECRSRSRWLERYADEALYDVDYKKLENHQPFTRGKPTN